jgi:hypothetical protein
MEMRLVDECEFPIGGKDKHKHKTKNNFTFDKISTDDALSLPGKILHTSFSPFSLLFDNGPNANIRFLCPGL